MTAPWEKPPSTVRSAEIPCSSSVASSQEPACSKVGKKVAGSGKPDAPHHVPVRAAGRQRQGPAGEQA